MSGLFVAIVGPSGVGKDSLIRALALRFRDDPDYLSARRVITREADANEDHATLDPESFRAQARAGRFALTWTAHGLSYGVPIGVDDALAAGKTVVCNLSRSVVAQVRRRWSNTLVVAIAARPEVLAARLRARGREPAHDIATRLARPDAAEPPDAVVENDGDLENATDRLYALVLRRRSAPP